MIAVRADLMAPDLSTAISSPANPAAAMVPMAYSAVVMPSSFWLGKANCVLTW